LVHVVANKPVDSATALIYFQALQPNAVISRKLAQAVLVLFWLNLNWQNAMCENSFKLLFIGVGQTQPFKPTLRSLWRL